MSKFLMGARRSLVPLSVVLGPMLVMAQQPQTVPPGTPGKTVPPGTPVTISVTPAAPTAPPASLLLGPRHGHVTPERHGCTHTGGGNIDVVQPTPDTVVITMTGAAVAYGSICDAYASQNCDLEQEFEVVFDNPKLKKAKLTMEGRVIGLLRTHCRNDTAGYDNAGAGVLSGPSTLLSVAVPPHSVGGGQNLSVNDHGGPFSVPIVPGKYCLQQTFVVWARAHKCVLGKGPSAEFAPDPALDPLWISYREPFHGAIKKDFGFQVTIKVAEDTDAASAEDNEKPNEKQPERIPVKPKLLPDEKP